LSQEAAHSAAQFVIAMLTGNHQKRLRHKVC